MADRPEIAAQLNAAAARVCPHCAAGSEPRYRPETGEFVHDFDASIREIDTPSLAVQGGPPRLLRGTFAHVLCGATDLRRAHLADARHGFLR